MVLREFGGTVTLHKQADYLMSFVTGGLYFNESVAIAELHQRGELWATTAIRALKQGAFPVRKESSAKRTIRELTHRLGTLSADELEFFINGDRDEQLAMLWLGICRVYRFIGEFATDVVSDRYAAYRTDLGYDDFDAFFARKQEWSDQLANIKPSTRTKLRAVMFRLMHEAGILSHDDRIVPTILSARLAMHIEDHCPEDLSFFPGAQRNVGSR